jgi:hypothetical protein
LPLQKSLTVAATVAASALALAPSASADVQIRTDLQPGDLVTAGSIGAVVPPPGQFVHAAAAGTAGRPPQTLMVSTRSDGAVAVGDAGTQSVASDLFDEVWGTPHECEDRFYLRWRENFSQKLAKWKTTMNWWFRAVTTPSDVDRTAAREDVKRAIRNVVTARNNCGMADQISATHTFQGDTTAYTDIAYSDPHDYCDHSDGKSVVAFGWLGTGSAALTCIWGHDDGGTYYTIDSSDTRMNTNYDYRYYAGARPIPCVYPFSRLSVEALMTSAFASAHGLEYIWPGVGKHDNLTMWGADFCDEETVTLGKGDILGLQTMY